MTLFELDNYLNKFLQKENFSSDISLNGIQIQNENPDSKQIKKIAFAVDACQETAALASKCGADVLFVHHGLFWGYCNTITGSFYKRIKQFISNDLALIAYHIPLDANKPYGNNYVLADRINLKKTEGFGKWRGMTIGVKGVLPKPLTIDELAEKIMRPGKKPNVVLKNGKELIKTVGIISGGASEDVEAAVEENLDCYITGEFAHEQYHFAKEMQINIIGGGHYETETCGVSAVMKKIQKELSIECEFIDLPTQL